METAGIIAEYNPFHNGHGFLQQQAAQLASRTAAVLSSYFVQRGEPALYSPFLRAEAALKEGLDLAVSLPTAMSLAPGELFARAGVLALAREKGVPVKEADPVKLQHLCGGTHHQGMVAVGAVKAYASLEDLFQRAQDRQEPPFFVICDGLEDPHNLGAVLRSAECAGAHGVIVPQRRSVGLTWAVGKASAGAVEHLPVARVKNLPTLLEDLKARGLWIYAADMDGSPWCQTDFTGPVALVIGSEGSGVSRLVKEKADFVVSLPLRGRINSLNASVAAGILCTEVARQRSGLEAINP